MKREGMKREGTKREGMKRGPCKPPGIYCGHRSDASAIRRVGGLQRFAPGALILISNAPNFARPSAG